MADAVERIAQLRAQGFQCSQILLILGLERQGKKNPDLVRAMAGLANGLGNCGKTCGVLTGSACLLGLYAGRGELQEQKKNDLEGMILDLVNWFEEKYGKAYGGVDCQIIVNDDPWNRMLRCPNMVIETYMKVQEILEDSGFIE